MKKLSILSLLVAMIFYHGAQAQQDSVFTLDECINYAFTNQADVKNASLDQQISKNKVNETRAYGLPQINFEGSSMYNVALQPMFMTNETANQFINGGAPLPPGVDPNGTRVIPNLFQLKASNTATLNASQIIFDGSYLVGLKASKTYNELATKSMTQTKIETTDKITKGFYLVLINEQRMKLLDANIARIDTSLKQLKEVNKSGFAEGLDVNRLEVTSNNLKTDRLNVQNQLILTYALLKYQMSYPVNQELKLSGTLDELVARLNTVSNPSTGAFDYNTRIEYSLLKTQKRLEELNYKNTRALSYPKLVAFGTAGIINMNNDYMKLYSTKYYGYGFVGAKLTVPIFTGGNHYYQQQGAKLKVKKVENNMELMEDAIDLQVQQTKIILDNNLENIKSQKRNLELAEQVIKQTKIKYDEGVGSNLEVVDAENSFKNAQTNYYDAVYNALVSLIDYQKATGSLFTE
ncbi:TolC family protein [Cytophaga hutchinsonii]|jgi:outer membrane protein|uniref:Outer membrane protein n=1 Tax=Cytophaga hutchinsonii (strain ATCC 33406 / DSM 1761 / CIP 103989 / NBRC 15051 / NCIMB 9469 / D465) TaxID=269798 RepID=A0A6N4STS5_CYTH3|nr:TolC family protein [Cytophaga hutchinsonii]ABG59769.1 outer membrane protein [Cytophaga hutchinsonii ATCC 33406]SFX64471.1 Outer membrane protein TolC [Cytophaga hutchinsonii ATCC 33406]